jgi:hypothetical protein
VYEDLGCGSSFCLRTAEVYVVVVGLKSAMTKWGYTFSARGASTNLEDTARTQ